MALHNTKGRLIGDDYSIEAFTRHGLDLVKDFTAAVDGVEYDTIVVTGISGLLWGARVAEYLGRNLMIIRKQSDVHHSDFDAEGYLGKRWIFADDFVSAGDTLFRVWSYMHEYHRATEFVGLFEYAVWETGNFTARETLIPEVPYDDEDVTLCIGHESAANRIREVLTQESAIRPLSEQERAEIQDETGQFKHLGYAGEVPSFTEAAQHSIPQQFMIGTGE